MTKTIALGSLIVSLAACTHEVEPSPSPLTVCDGIEAKRIALNGVQNNGIQNNALTGNGTTLAGVALGGRPAVGAILRGVRTDGTTLDLLVASESDGLFELTHEDSNVCADGGKGIFVPGIWDERGARRDSDTLSTFACKSGAIAKCALWGYDGALHQACTRMVRADYCGDGTSSTRDGTPIDVFDTRGVQSAANEPGFAFEAGWNESGATCVNRPRFASAVPSCWRDLPTCGTAEEAITRGALLMNASRPTCH